LIITLLLHYYIGKISSTWEIGV